ncbi:MAG: prepilin-type N-terminal cleavage/methylation domain-containing protein [Actinobacteria bacterium]|nr:prepilin-type N-terminal cleavage/methylation domain-containing protein [Actinomycetota bacterium]
MSAGGKERLGSMCYRLPVRVRDDEAGFSMIELMVVIAILGFLIGMGIWLLYGAGSTTSARTAQGQIAQDLKLCAKKVETTKTTWGMLYYGSNYVTAENRNMYLWFYFDDTATLQFCDPPIGATPGKSGYGGKVPLQEGAKIIGEPYPWMVAPAPNQDFLYVRFKPVGSTIAAQFDSGSGWQDVAPDPGYMRIDVSDRKGDAEESVRIYKLGYIGFQ